MERSSWKIKINRLDLYGGLGCGPIEAAPKSKGVLNNASFNVLRNQWNEKLPNKT